MKLSRFDFFRILLGAGAVAAAKAEGIKPLPHLVAVSDVHRTAPPYPRVILEGQDISDVCQRAEIYSDGTLRALCLCKNADGSFRLTPRPINPRQDAVGVVDVTTVYSAGWQVKLPGLISPLGYTQDVLREWRTGSGYLVYPGK